MRRRANRTSWSGGWLVLGAWVLVLGGGGFGRALGQPAADDGGLPGADPVRAAQERVIRDAYRAHEDAISRSGKYVEIELSDFRTALPAEFGRVLYTELVDLPGSYEVQIQPMRMLASDGEVLGRSYQTLLRYKKEPNDPTHGLPLTVADAVAIAREYHRGTEPETITFTSFQVTTKIEFETLRYRAVAGWTRLPAGDDPGAYFVNDPVMSFLPEILTQTDPIYPETELYRRLGEKEERLRAEIERRASTPEAACVVETMSYEYPVVYLDPDTTGHASGNHAASAGATWTCSCDSACTSRASSSLVYKSCTEHGQVSGVLTKHERRIGEELRPGAVVNALSKGATTGAVYGCFIQQCVGAGGCGYNISGGGGTPLQLSFSGSNLIYSGQIPFEMECGACTEALPQAARRRSGGTGPYHQSTELVFDPGYGQPYRASHCWSYCSPVVLSSASACYPTPAPCVVSYCDAICDRY